MLKEFAAVAEDGRPRLKLVPQKGEPTIAGIEVLAPEADDGRAATPHPAPSGRMPVVGNDSL